MHELVIVVFYFYMVRIGHSVSTSISHMVRNGHSVILFPNWLLWLWYEMVNYGAKWLWCKIHMVRNGFWLWYEIAILWYEMVMVRNDLLRYFYTLHSSEFSLFQVKCGYPKGFKVIIVCKD